MVTLNKYSTEAEIAKIVIGFLEADGWDVYEEVRLEYAGPRADIIGVRAGIVHIVEVKRTMSFTLLAQAVQWSRWSHYTSVAIPETKGERTPYVKDRGRNIAYRCFTYYGIGILRLDQQGDCRFVEHPKLHRWAAWGAKKFVLPALHEGLKGFAEAGSKQRYWTPFRETVRRLEHLVETRPGISLKAACAILKDGWHYASEQSGRSSLTSMLGTDIIPNIEIDKIKGNWLLYPKGTFPKEETDTAEEERRDIHKRDSYG